MSDEFVDIGEHGEKDLLNVYFAGKRSVVGFNIKRLFSQSDIQAVEDFLLKVIEENNSTDLDLDFSGVEYISSAVFQALFKIRRQGVHIRIVNPAPKILKIIQLTRLERLFDVVAKSH